MRIRSATPGDVARLQALTLAAFSPYIGRIGREPAPLGIDHAHQVALGRVRVAERDSEVLGFTVLVAEPDHLLLDVIAVDPRERATGVGTRLLEDAEVQAGFAALPEVRLYTNELMAENLGWYPRRGYRETHRADQNGFRRVFFAKSLPPDASSTALDEPAPRSGNSDRIP
jgi:ribosomal protein S18 acetylase RimI-like enzyme